MSINWGPRTDPFPGAPRAGGSPPCPHCGNQEVEVFGKSAVSSITWLMCRVCGHVWQSKH